MGNTDLKAFVEDHQRLFVLTGAGCSTNSGIPDYRDADGSWKRTPPVRFQAFIADVPSGAVIGPAAHDRLASLWTGAAQ